MKNDRINYTYYKEKFIKGEISYNFLKSLTIAITARLIVKHILLDLVILAAVMQSVIFTFGKHNILQMTAMFIEIYIIFNKVYNILLAGNTELSDAKKEREAITNE